MPSFEGLTHACTGTANVIPPPPHSTPLNPLAPFEGAFRGGESDGKEKGGRKKRNERA